MNDTKTLNDAIKKLNEATTTLGRSRGVDLQQLSTLTKEPTAGQAYGSYNGSEYDTALNSAIRGSRPTAPVDENKIRNDVLAQFQGEIDATNKIYAQKLAEAKQSGLGALGTTRATQARSGLLGSDFGAAQTSNVEGQNRGIQNSILNENAVAISAILGQARKEAAQEIADKRAAQQKGLDTYIGYLSSKVDRTNKRLGNLALSFVQRGVDPTTLGEAEMAQLQKDYGASKDDILAAYQSATTPTAKGTPTASIQEYEYAKQNGYTGSYVDYQNEDANRKAKATGGSGLTPYQQGQSFLAISNKYQADPIINVAIQGQTASTIADQVLADPSKATNQLKSLYLLVKNLDPNSAVREGEISLADKTQSYLQQFGNTLARVSEGRVVSPDAAKELAQATKELAGAWTTTANRRQNQYSSQASVAGVGEQFKSYLGGGGSFNQPTTITPNTADSYTLPNGTVVTRQPDGTYQ